VLHHARRIYLLFGIMILMLSFCFVPFTPSNQNALVKENEFKTADFVGKNILFDEAHSANGSAIWAPGNASMFSWLLGENGYNSSTNFNQPLDSGILSEYDILVIFFPQVALTSGEITAITSFVNGGGGLLLVGVNYGNTWGFKTSYMNALSSIFGITFAQDTVDVVATTFADHNITYGMTSYWTNVDQIYGCSLEVTGSAQSVITSAGKNLTAVAEYGLGRVVCASSAGPFMFYRYQSYGHGESHMHYSLNTIDWLAGNPKRDPIVPEIAKITVGTGPNLGPSELEQYHLFVGQYHDHTTHSDGANTPEEMIDAGLARSMDFMVMTDHSHKNPTPIEGITGGQAMLAIANEYGLDIHITVGAELSSVLHTTGFPLTANIWTDDQQTAVDEIHAQGGIATFAHPGISPNYATVFENFESYGYDAMEVVNSNYFRGEGEEGLLYNFMGANDHHSALYVGSTATAVFVLNPSGPNGTISDSDIVDAVLNRRIVILDTLSSMVYGDEIWVDRYCEILDQAKADVAAAHSTILSLKTSGNEVGLSEQYLDEADTALTYWNPARALNYAANATSAFAVGLNIDITSPSSLNVDEDFDLTVGFANNHTYGVSFNASFYVSTAVSFSSPNYIVDVSAKSTKNTYLDGHSNPYGVAVYYLYVHDFNTSEYLMPIMFRARNVIDNVSYVARESGDQYDIDLSFFVGRESTRLINSVVLFYDDGTGETSAAMIKGWNTYDLTLTSYDPGSSITFHVRVVTTYSDTFNLSEQVVTLPGGETTTTTTTTTSGGPGQALDPLLLIAIGGGGAVIVLVLVVVVMKKRGV
jgi:hypothetical protein